MSTRFVPLSSIDRLAADLLRSMDVPFPRMDRQIPLDAFHRGDELVMHFDLPGVPEDEIELSVERRVLSVKAKRDYAGQENDHVFVAERPWGTLSRQVVLGDSLDVNRITAQYDNGVLTVTVPVAANAKSRRIEINHAPVSAGSRELEAETVPVEQN
jgi:HSP20 family protein